MPVAHRIARRIVPSICRPSGLYLHGDGDHVWRRTGPAVAPEGAWLQNRGMVPGARVALMIPNILEYPVALLAVLRAGYTVVNVNPLYTPRELQH